MHLLHHRTDGRGPYEEGPSSYDDGREAGAGEPTPALRLPDAAQAVAVSLRGSSVTPAATSATSDPMIIVQMIGLNATGRSVS